MLVLTEQRAQTDKAALPEQPLYMPIDSFRDSMKRSGKPLKPPVRARADRADAPDEPDAPDESCRAEQRTLPERRQQNFPVILDTRFGQRRKNAIPARPRINCEA